MADQVSPIETSQADQLLRFIFEGTDVRGEWVQLDRTYKDALVNHHYPPAVRELMGEFLAAAALLGATLKFDGSLVLQARSEAGQIPLIMAESTSALTVRAIVRGAEEATGADFESLLGKGLLSITIDPTQGKRYQGIVALEAPSLAACLEAYFHQSEQLPTRIWLYADSQRAGGLFLQELPSQRPAEERAEQWQHLCALANTVQPQELLQLSGDELLYRLFHQDQLRLLRRDGVGFRCSCSQERTGAMLFSLGRAELDDIIREQGTIEVNCEFCNQLYVFNGDDIAALFADSTPSTRH